MSNCLKCTFWPLCCAFSGQILPWRQPSCFRQQRRTAAALHGVQAAGVALCYGNNNGRACKAGSIHPMAPNVAQSSPRLFSCPARLSNEPSLPPPTTTLPLLSTSLPSASPTLQFQFLPTFLLFFYLHASHLLLLQPLLSISSFLLPHKESHSPIALRGEQNVLWKCKPLHRNAITVGICALRFFPALLLELLCVPGSLRGSLFSIALVGEGYT